MKVIWSQGSSSIFLVWLAHQQFFTQLELPTTENAVSLWIPQKNLKMLVTTHERPQVTEHHEPQKKQV